MKRRRFLTTLALAPIAPIVIKSEVLMPVRSIVTPAFDGPFAKHYPYTMGEIGSVDSFAFYESGYGEISRQAALRMSLVKEQVIRKAIKGDKRFAQFVPVSDYIELKRYSERTAVGVGEE